MFDNSQLIGNCEFIKNNINHKNLILCQFPPDAQSVEGIEQIEGILDDIDCEYLKAGHLIDKENIKPVFLRIDSELADKSVKK